jgi:hypothetical protein
VSWGEWMQIGGATVHVRHSGKRPEPLPPCRFCKVQSTKLCDFPLSSPQRVTHRKTCDAPMCDDHATAIGPNSDLCPPHAEQWTGKKRERQPGEEG